MKTGLLTTILSICVLGLSATFLISEKTKVSLDSNDATLSSMAQQEITLGSSLSCRSNVQLSLGYEGYGVIEPQTLLADQFPDYSNFRVVIVDPPVYTDTADCSMLGDQIKVEVRDTVNGNMCWSYVLVEEKLPPQLSCDTVDVPCNINPYANNIDLFLPDLEDNCTDTSDLTITYNQTQSSQGCQSDYVLIINRTWYISDESGNTTTCDQYIRLERPDIDSVQFPQDDTLYCPNTNTDPNITGVPTLYGEEVSTQCGLMVWNDDNVIDKCGGSFKVMRTWNVMDWCANEQRTELQVIQVLDTAGPVITCPNDTIIENVPTECYGVYDVPNIDVTDDCAEPNDIHYDYYVNNVYTNQTQNIQLNEGDNTIRVVVHDGCYNYSECTYTVTVIDSEVPTVICYDVAFALPNTGDAIVGADAFNSIVYMDNCGIVDTVLRRMNTHCGDPDDLIFGDEITLCCEDVGDTVMVEVKAFDAQGLMNSCMFEVYVQDNVPPIVNCPADTTINCDDITDSLSVFGSPFIDDNCIFTVDTIVNYNLDACKEGTITRTWMATDEFGNDTACTQTITVVNPYPFDSTTIVWPADTMVSECIMGGYSPDSINSTPQFQQTPCNTVGVSYTDMSMDIDSACLQLMRTWTIYDSCEDRAFTHVQNIQVINNAPPVLTVPGDITLYANSNCVGVAALDSAITNDCSSGVMFTNSYTSGGALVDTLFPLGQTQIIFEATDECNNVSTDTTIVTVLDTTSPEIICVSDTVFSTDPGVCEATVTLPIPMTNDNCIVDSVVNNYNNSEDASDTYPIGTTTVIYTVFDQAGNSDTCSFTVTIEDNEPPELTCPTDTILLYLDSLCQVDIPDFTDSVSVTDNCTPEDSIQFVQTPMSGQTLMMVQDTFIQVIATDTSGNSDTCQIAVSLVDTLPPSIICPEDDTLYADNNCAAVIGNYRDSAMVMSNCTQMMDIQINQSPDSGTVISNADTVYVITMTAEDASGNMMSCTFNLTLLDTTPPTILGLGDTTVTNDSSFCGANIVFNIPTVFDNCFVDTFYNDYNFGEDASDFYPVGDTIVTYTVIDTNGNITQDSFMVTVTDDEAPELVCQADTTLFLDGDCEAMIPDFTEIVVVTDNCTETDSLIITQNIPSGTVYTGEGDTSIIVTATDEYNNSSQCTIQIFFEDTVPPSLVCPGPDTLYSNANCKVIIPNYIVQATISDNCTDNADLMITQTPAPSDTIMERDTTILVTITVIDEAGEFSLCSLEVTVLDSVAPIIVCPQDTSVNADPGQCEAFVNIPIPFTNDNCGVDSLVNDYNFTEDASDIYPEGTTKVIYTVFDSSGNSDTCSFTVTVVDDENPMIVCPPDTTLQLDSMCKAEIPDLTNSVILNDNCTPINDITVSQTPAPQTIFMGEGDTIVELIATDGSGNMDTCFVTITFEDTIPPEIMCPATQTIYVDSMCVATLPDYTDSATINDNCDTLSNVTISQNPSPGSTFMAPDTVTVTLTAMDSSGNSSQCNFEVIVLDTIHPDISCPMDITVQADSGLCVADVMIPIPTYSDNCIVDTIYNDQTDTIDASGIYPVGTTAVTYVVEDNSGLIASCTFTVTVEDDEAPIVICPDTQSVSLDMNCQAIIPDFRDSVVVSDNCTPIDDITISQSPDSGEVYTGVGDTIIQIIATDSAGNSDTCSFVVNFEDSIPPSIICPSNQTVFVDSMCEAVLLDYTDSAIVADNCEDSVDITITQTPMAGTIFNAPDTVTVTLIATDNSGNTSQCSFEVYVVDNMNPNIMCPQNISVSNDPGLCSADISIAIPAYSDNCIVDSISNDYTDTIDASGVYPVGTTIVTYIVKDNSGNTTTCSFTVTVNDDEAPNAICPSDVTLTLDSLCQAEIPDFKGGVTVTDNCSPVDSIDLQQFPMAGTIYDGEGDTTIQIIATDTLGNSDTCTLVVTFTDSVPPIITCPSNDTAYADTICEVVISDYRPEASISDNCTDTTAITINQIPDSGTVIVGADTIIEISLIATDLSGNSDTCTFDLEILDTIPPSITCLGDVTIYADDSCKAIIPDLTDSVVNADNCDPNMMVTATQSPSPGDTLMGEQTISITFTVTDMGGQTQTCQISLTVEDTIPPTVVCPPDSQLIADSLCQVTIPDLIDQTFISDNCTDSVDLIVTQDPAADSVITVMDGDTIQVVITVTDSSGNSDSCIVEFEIIDSLPPTLVCTGDTLIVGLDPNCEGAIPDVTSEIVVLEDNCIADPNIIITQVPIAGTIFSVSDPFDTTVVITVTDSSGNSSTCSVVVSFEDSIPPMITCPPDTLVACDFNYDGDLDSLLGVATATDNCSPVTITKNVIEYRNNCDLVDSIYRIFTATDDSGNSSSCTQVVTTDGVVMQLDSSDFSFPDTVLLGDCNFTDPEDIPSSIPMLDSTLNVCNVIDYVFSDSINENPMLACIEIFRTFTVTDSCYFDPNTGDGQFEFEQYLVIQDTTPPTFNVPTPDTMVYLDTCGTVDVFLDSVTASDCSGIDTIYNNSAYAFDSTGGDVSGPYPFGIHNVNVYAMDSCGNLDSTSIQITVTDSFPDTLTCNFKIINNLDSNTLSAIFVSHEFFGFYGDSCGNAPLGEITTSFDPTDLSDTIQIINCDSIGNSGGGNFIKQDVLYVFLDSMLVDSCDIELGIENPELCDSMMNIVSGQIVSARNTEFDDADVVVSNERMSKVGRTDDMGIFLVEHLHPDREYIVDPYYDGDPRAGVSTFDMLLILRHILDLSTIDDPYFNVAADVDKSKVISGSDLIHLRKLLLRMTDELPVDNWRFITEDYEFFDPSQASGEDYKEQKLLMLNENVKDANFIGLKVGDVDGSVDMSAKARSAPTVFEVKASGQNGVDIVSSKTEMIYGFQLSIRPEHVKQPQLISGKINFSHEDYRILENGNILITWISPHGISVEKGDVLFSLSGVRNDKLQNCIQLNSKELNPEAYWKGDQSPSTVELRFINSEIDDFALYQNVPNPWSDRTLIPFNLNEEEMVKLKVLDASGKQVFEQVVYGQIGYNELTLKSTELEGPGIYYYQLEGETFVASKKMIVLQ